ncbi:hypothetical protein GCM10011374_30220 [Kocuria dechangensis]|uniref:Uncharacterized protein n=1 Tax=Kocuria dechangensis TaxID=1176249 RepID=A0A917LWZ6_9MICC|nr:hypothetical protein [Kocuria dechangensis]GGG64536.1 hypothetical protein GCM10011374_30220 [Kocuria dechangensis]
MALTRTDPRTTRITDPVAAANLAPGTWGYVADRTGRAVVRYGSVSTLAPETRVFPEYPRTECGFQLHRDADGTYTARYFGPPPVFAALGELPANRAPVRLAGLETIGALESARTVAAEARRTGEMPLIAARAAGYALDTLCWWTAETLEKLASGLEAPAQKAKPTR